MTLPAIPALVSWIPRVEDPTVKEMLIRAVTDRAARGIAAGLSCKQSHAELPLTSCNARASARSGTCTACATRVQPSLDDHAFGSSGLQSTLDYHAFGRSGLQSTLHHPAFGSSWLQSSLHHYAFGSCGL